MRQAIVFSLSIVLFLNSLNAQKIPLDTAVHTGVLPNGFTYYIRYNGEPRDRVILFLVNNVGSVLEDDDQQGLAHFMEHMNFNGTIHYPKNELVSYLQKSGVRFGADLNAYTSFDETVYQLPIPADDTAVLRNGFQIMRDWAQNATLDSLEIDKERGVVLEEQRLGRGASERMQRQYFPVIFNQSRYAERLPIGKVDILKNFPPSVIRRFHHDWYRPDLQALVVVGDIDPVKTEQLVKKLFADLEAPSGERPRTEYRAPLTGTNQFLTVTDPEMSQTVLQVIIKHKEELLVTEQDYFNSMQRQIFNMILSERFAALSQTPDLPFMDATANIDGFGGGLDAFSLEIALKENKYKEGFEAAWSVIENVKRFGFTQSELDRAKLNYLKSIESAFKERNKTNSESIVGEYQRNFLHKEASPGIAWEYQFVKNRMEEISLSQINKTAKEYIRDHDRDILMLAPEKGKSQLPDSATVTGWITGISNQEMTAFTDAVSNKPLFTGSPVPGKILQTKTIKSIASTELTLSNGIRVILKPTDFKNDEIWFIGFSSGGTSLYGDADYQSARNAAMIADFGLDDFNPVQLNKMLSGKKVKADPYIEERFEGIEGFTVPKDLETTFQLIHLRFTDPRKDTIMFNNIINSSREIIQNRYSEPVNVFTDTVNWVLANYNDRFAPPTIEKLNQVDLEKMYKIYKERFADASGFTFLFVGNFKTDSIRPLIEKYLGSLPSLGRKETAGDLGIHIPEDHITKKVFKGTEDKATVRMVFSGDYIYNAENNLALNALKEVLAIKITQHLREDEGEVYSPHVTVNYNKYPRSRFAFTVSLGCAPSNADHLMDAVLKELAILRQNGPTQEDLDKFKAEYKRVQEQQQTQNEWWLGYLTKQYQNQEIPESVNAHSKLLDNLTILFLKKAANLYLSGKNEIRLELLPVR